MPHPFTKRQRGSVSECDMASKRQAAAEKLGESSKKAKRQVTVATFNKWKSQFEREHETLSWLRCDEDADDKSLVAVLWCQACRTHERSITGLKNFSRVWIVGSTNQRSSNVVDHAKSEQHRAAMSRVYVEAAKASNLPVTTYLWLEHNHVRFSIICA